MYIAGMAEESGRGAPTKYKEEYNEQAYKLCLLGATDKDMADFFGVVEDTINEWKKVHPNFSVSVKNGKQVADGNVADRLYQRAMGFEHDSEEIKVVSDGQGAGSSVERVAVRKVYPPDTAAAIFWLKNRQPRFWKDKIETEHSGAMSLTWNETKTYDSKQETDHSS